MSPNFKPSVLTKQKLDELNRYHMRTACNLWACFDQLRKSCLTAARVITDGSIIISVQNKLWFILAFVFVGCNHITAWLILMSAHIFPASCLHFRTSLRSITANRWVPLPWSRHSLEILLLLVDICHALSYSQLRFFHYCVFNRMYNILFCVRCLYLCVMFAWSHECVIVFKAFVLHFLLLRVTLLRLWVTAANKKKKTVAH